MIKEVVSIMDFGSSKITVLVGVPEVNKTFRLLAYSDCDYDGFADGEFIDTDNLKLAMKNAISNVEKQLNFKIKNLIIGAPAEFCFASDTTIIKNFNKKIKITPKIISNLFLNDTETNTCETHTIINKAPLYYLVNDVNKTNNPIGLLASKIELKCGYIFLNNQFRSLISGVVRNIGIKEFDFVSNTLAESIYLIDELKRNEGALLVDCGYISTSVSQSLGDGLSGLKSFSFGGGFITSDLSKHLQISFEEAEELKRQAVITLKPSGVDCYVTSTNQKFSVKVVNEIIMLKLDRLVETIKKCIDSFDLKLPEYIPLYFTGGGINYIDGITDYLRKQFDRPVELIEPRALLYKRPDLSSSISLLDMTINLYK